MCIVGSTLYMFECSTPNKNSYKAKVVLTYQLPLPSSNVFDLFLDESSVELGSFLQYGKSCPMPIPTPDGTKILVISSFIDRNKLYDSAVGSWRVLKGFDDLMTYPKSISITGHTFITANDLLLYTNIGTFHLDMRYSNVPFERLSHYGHMPKEISSPFDHPFVSLRAQGLYLMSHHAQDIITNEFFDYPKLDILGPEYYFKGRWITPLYDDEEGCKFCVIQTQVHSTTLLAYLVANLYLIYAKKRSKRKEKIVGEDLPATKIIKSFKFQLNVETDGEDFFPSGLFPIYA